MAVYGQEQPFPKRETPAQGWDLSNYVVAAKINSLSAAPLLFS